MTVVCAQMLVLLKQSGIALDRDVIFMANAGEEGTTHVGIDFMVKEHWEKIACEFAINEGGMLRERDGKIHYIGISTGEKVPRPGVLYAKGTGGHGSRPLVDNAVVHIADAIAKLGKWQPPMRLNETTRVYLKRLAAISPPDEAFLYSNIEDPVMGALVQEKLRAAKPGINSMLRTSVAPTMMKAGYRINVIPGDANAQVDIRLLPDEDFPAFEALVRKVIDNPRVEFVLSDGSRQPSPPSPIDSELFKAFENQQAKMFPGSTTLPMMLTGATDSAQLRAKGVHAYGIGTVITEEDSAKIHGHDERVPVAGLKTFLEYLHAVVVEVAAAK
jgi:acetylornithine deacetylase/succinyl-diaminopimelate desuccinylase-like protein